MTRNLFRILSGFLCVALTPLSTSSFAAPELAAVAAAAPVAANRLAAEKVKNDLPPSADLHYTIKAIQSGFVIDGNASMRWHFADGKFTLSTETRATLVGKILEQKSEGAVDAYGLAPLSFTEKRYRKQPTTATFNRDTKIISFSGSEQTYPIEGGEQDRASVIWQLISIARGKPARFKTGSTWNFFVAGRRDAELWTFKVMKQEVIKTALGEVNALHVVRSLANDKGQQLAIWLAPSMDWYPVRLQLAESNGEYVEQILEKISKK